MVYSRNAALLCLVFSLVLACIVPTFFANVKIIFVAAPLVMLMYNASLGETIWLSFFAGLIEDVVTLSPRFGFFALSFVIAMRLLYPYRLYFFKDSSITLPLMTYLFSLLAAVIEGLIALFFDIPSPLFGIRSIISNVFIMPIIDVFFAVITFMVVPFLYSAYCRKKSKKHS